jgi:copper homeostasis protein
MLLEIACFSLEGAILAEKAGADRIELCAGPLEGGLTPAFSMISLAKSILNIPFHVMIRPREGDFLYTSRELKSMEYDIEMIKDKGIEGVVLGILKSDGTIDIQNLSKMVRIADPMNITFHRAFDLTRDPLNAMNDIISTGTRRILTSGHRSNAWEGRGLITELIQAASGKITIMPGSGVNSSIITDLYHSTRAIEFHASARRLIKGGMIYSNPIVNLHAGSTINDTDVLLPDPEEINKMKNELNKLEGI